MPKIAPINPSKLIRLLEKEGFKVVRQRGSHIILINEKKTRIVVPLHPGKDIKPGLCRTILREAGVSREKFFRLQKEK